MKISLAFTALWGLWGPGLAAVACGSWCSPMTPRALSSPSGIAPSEQWETEAPTSVVMTGISLKIHYLTLVTFAFKSSSMERRRLKGGIFLVDLTFSKYIDGTCL